MESLKWKVGDVITVMSLLSGRFGFFREGHQTHGPEYFGLVPKVWLNESNQGMSTFTLIKRNQGYILVHESGQEICLTAGVTFNVEEL
jgi:hypothetical protein